MSDINVAKLASLSTCTVHKTYRGVAED
jgi:hypothetical protein